MNSKNTGNIYPSKIEYLEKAKSYNLVPVYKEYVADTETPVSIFIKAGGPDNKMFLLESMEGAKKLGRYSFIGNKSTYYVSFDNGLFSINDSKKVIFSVKTDSPLDELKNVMDKYRIYKNPDLDHFTGGAVGYLSYDLVRYFENIDIKKDKIHLPEMLLYLTDSVIVFDHFLNRMKIISTVDISGNPQKAYHESLKKIFELEEKIFFPGRSIKGNDFSSEINYLNKADIKSNFKKEQFLDAVRKSKKYIMEGDVFQVVISQRFCTDISAKPFNIYRALRTTNPSPYMYYINFGNFKVIGSSPEPLIKIKGSKIMTYPIAGTKKRGASQKEDKFLVKSLLQDKKEIAEHNMLVDLSRNDLGRVCKYGSIKIKKYMSVEKYSHVMHLVSAIVGTLNKTSTIFDALKSAFPAGTLTGAPKIRAMQIINDIEPDNRGIYGGVIGYFGYDGSLDTCIAIRTAIII